MVTDPKIDAWYADGITAQSVDQMMQDIHNLVTYFVPQHYTISLAEPLNFNMLQPWVKGVTTSSTILGIKSEACWIDESLKRSMGH